jgi:hypothetical protein
VSWPTEVARFLADQLGITERRQAEQQWRENAAAARPGQTWTITVAKKDSRGRKALSWVSGPVDSFQGRRGLGEIKMLGEENLPNEARRLGPLTGLLAAKTRWHLEPGDQHVPPRLPAAGAGDLEAVPAGVEVMIEHRVPAHPGLRCIESGTTGHVMHQGNQVGRHIGDSWVLLNNVIGLLHHVYADQDERIPLWENPAPTAAPTDSPVSITADSGMSVDGQR